MCIRDSIIGVHTGLDQQAAGQTPFGDLALVTGLKTGAKVSVAGGIKAATVRQVVDAGADIVVAGAAIYGAADPEASAKEITGLAHGNNAGAAAGGFNFLPWVIAIAAAILAFFLYNNLNKPADTAVDGAAVEQQVEGAVDATTEAAGAAVEATAEATTEAAGAAVEATAEATTEAAAAVEAAGTAVEAKTDGLVGAAKEATGQAE